MNPLALKLKTRIVVFTTLVFLVVGVLGSLLSANLVFKQSQSTVIQQQLLLQDLAVNHIDNALQVRLDRLEAISHLLHDGEKLLDEDALQQLLDNLIGMHQHFNGGLIVMNADARIIVDSPVIAGRVGIDLSDREHAKQVKTTRAPMITHPLIGRGLQTPVFVISVPIISNNDEFIGYVFGVTRLADDNMITSLSKSIHGGIGNTYIIDFKNNLFVTSTRHELAMQPLPTFEKSEVLKSVFAGETSGMAQSFFDQKVAFSAQKLDLMDWHVLHTIPTAYVNKDGWHLLKSLAWFGGLSMLLFVALVYLLMRNQLKPIEQSAELIRAMTSGSLPQAVLPIHRQDEVGVLIDAFNRQWAQLQQEADFQIEEMHNLFNVILDNTTDYIYFKDEQSRMRFCSQNLADLTGHPSWREMVGKFDAELFPADMAQAYFEEEIPIFSEGKAVIDSISPYENQAGERGWVQTNKWPVWSEDGKKVVGLFGISRDITERLHLEKSNQETFTALKKAEAIAKIGNWHLNHRTEKLFWSDEIFKIFEVDKDIVEPSYEYFLSIVHPQDRERVRNEFQHSLETKANYNITHRLVMQDGQIKYVKEQCENDFDEDGVVLDSFGTVQDITEQYNSQEALRLAATVFESAEGMMVTDVNGTILRVNQAFTDITGYSLDEVVGQNPRILCSGRQDRAFYSDMWQSILSKGLWEGEIWNRRKNGEVYPEYLRITAVKDRFGEFVSYVATLSDITLSKAANEEIRSLAFFDPLTKLPNRRLLLDRLDHALSTSARSDLYGALLYMDVDYFKNLNDTYGHSVGDLLLQQVAERLSLCIREGDTAARIGGDEFVVLLENLSDEVIDAAAKTEHVAKKIQRELNQTYQLKEHSRQMTLSIGITLFKGHEQEVDDLLKQADIAMYQSKNEGRNTLRFFDPKMQEVILAREKLYQALRKAVSEHEFKLHYQIQVDRKGHPIGAEALIRWQHPKMGMIPPMDFIPLAEETGLILPIGQWVLETACAQLQSWQSNDLTSHLTVSINVSANQFNQNNFVEQVLATIQHYTINPARLKIELTESMLVDNIEDIIQKMKILNDAGVCFSLDDFGTGYSSLQYLKSLPIGELKIDQSFVRDIKQGKNDRAVVKMIIHLTQVLNIDVIAEGVETQEQLKYLNNNGCMHFQGYLFGKPMPVDMFEKLLV